MARGRVDGKLMKYTLCGTLDVTSSNEDLEWLEWNDSLINNMI